MELPKHASTEILILLAQLDLRIGEPMQFCIHEKLTKASESSFDLEGVAKRQI